MTDIAKWQRLSKITISGNERPKGKIRYTSWFQLLYRSPGSIGHKTVRQALHVVRYSNEMWKAKAQKNSFFVTIRTLKPDHDEIFAINGSGTGLNIAFRPIFTFAHKESPNERA